MRVLGAGNGWLKTEGDSEGWIVRWKAPVHPIYGVLAEHGPDVPPVFFLSFQYEIQTAASFAHDAPPQAISPSLRTWYSRN